MQITREKSPEGDVLRLEGEVDLHASPQLRSTLQNCAAEKVARLLVDFSGVDYIDSSGLATLVEYVRLMAEFGGKMALFGLKPKVRTIFELVRLDELFVLADSRQAALETLENSVSK